MLTFMYAIDVLKISEILYDILYMKCASSCKINILRKFNKTKLLFSRLLPSLKIITASLVATSIL